ncbi:sodium/hydrogen exchanger [Dehalobacter sp. DCA]|nr:sodium/hydrogen exchanger [Dehalobacter sp. DCA]
MDQTFLIATVWIFLAFMASLISIRLGISLALIEIIVGVVAGNVIHLQITDWVNFLASLGAVILTFLAGAEIDPASLKKNLKQSVVIGFLSPVCLVFVECL